MRCSTYLCKLLHLTLTLVSLPGHEHQFVLQLPQVLQRVGTHFPVLVMVLWDQQLHSCVHAQLDLINRTKMLWNRIAVALYLADYIHTEPHLKVTPF